MIPNLLGMFGIEDAENERKIEHSFGKVEYQDLQAETKHVCLRDIGEISQSYIVLITGKYKLFIYIWSGPISWHQIVGTSTKP